MRFTYACCLFVLAAISLGCGQSDTTTADLEPSSATPLAQAGGEQANSDVGVTGTVEQRGTEPISTGLQPDPAYPVPNLDAAGLMNYINQLVTQPERGQTEDEFLADQVSRARSRLIAADRIILSKGITADLLEAGVRAKLDALRTLAMLDSQGLGRHFHPFIDALNEGDSDKFARMGRLSRFWFEVDKLAYSQVDGVDQLMAELKQLLSDEQAGEAEFLAAQDASFVINNRGFQDEATTVLRMIGDRFANDAKLGAEAQDLIEKTAFREKVIAAQSGNRSDVKALFLNIRELLQDPTKLTVETLDNTLNAAQVLEYNGHFEEADKVFSAIKIAFRKSDDKQLITQAQLAADFAKKRLGMVGKEVRIEGNYVDGSDFQWNKYKGKVVLVDFWATTSSHWVSSVTGLKSAYDRFHEQGFEVVGINVDQDRRAVYDYLKREGLPWPTIVDEVSPGLDGNPNAIRYGIRAVPFVMLVGRDGKVADIHIRGTKLTQRIEALLAKPSSQNAQASQEIERK